MEFTFKIWKRGSPKKSNLFKALLHRIPLLKLTKKKKLVNPQISRQIPLEMGTGGGGGGGKKGGSGGKSLLKIKLK